MPVAFLTAAHHQRYGCYTGAPPPNQLIRYGYLDAHDHVRIAQRRTPLSRLGFALQLTTVRFLGTFLHNPIAVPDEVIASLIQQLQVPRGDLEA